MRPALGTPIDLARVDAALRSALDLLHGSYFAGEAPGSGGWYHMLDDHSSPGPTATAVSLDLLQMCGQRFDRYGEALNFLRLRQVESEDPKLHGGWATNTSFERPVMEATGWVARTLGTGLYQFVEHGPDSQAAYRWLVNNQNADGGWGSFFGTESRVWLTCLGLRALVRLNPHCDAIGRGVQWLLDHRHAELCAWGERHGSNPTVTHTSFALLTIRECRPALADERIQRAYRWLAENVDPAVIEDREARVETYNVTAVADGRPLTWQTALPHYGLPVAISALLRNPEGASPTVITAGVETILRERLENGTWPNVHGRGSQSIWAVAPFVHALHDLRSTSPALPRDQLLLSENAVVIQRESAKDEPLTALIRAQRRAAVGRFFARYWATLLLTVAVLLGLVFVALADLPWTQYVLSLILPVALFGVQEIRNRSGQGRGPKPPQRK